MARIFIDGFESGSVDLWDLIGATPILSTGVSGMSGTYCVDLGNNTYISKSITGVSTLYGAFLINISLASAGSLFIAYNGSQIMLQVRRNQASGCIEIYRDVTLLATGTIPINLNTTTLFEFYLYIADAGGRVTVKINTVSDIDFTGDTKPSTQTTITSIRIGDSYSYYDNFILDDANWIGNTKIQAIKPIGAGASAAWTPSAGANYACVDEIPPVDTDWVETNTINLTDTYEASNLTGVIDNIKCVQIQARAIQEGAPAPLNIDLVARSGGTDYPSADKAVQSTYYHDEFAIWETDPDTASAWTESGVNAVEIGIKSKT